jgi:hypothetical protein
MTNGTLQFAPAQKSKCKLRCAIFGPSGSGKTFSALRIASGMGGKIAVIDTEFGSASKYADRFKFDTLSLNNPTIDMYIQAMIAAGNAGYEVLILDSLSHGWQELLKEIDQLAKTKFKGNTWSAWSEGTPKQQELVKFIQTYPGHVIATMRSKTEWQTEQGTNGKTRPVRVGLTPEQGKGIEYEFDMLLELGTEHFCTVIKDRTGKYQDKIIEKPGEDFGKELISWLNSGSVSTQQNGTYGQSTSQAEFNNAFGGQPAQPANNVQQQAPPATQQQSAHPPAPQATQQPPQNEFNPPASDGKSEPVLQALADYFRKQEHPQGYQFDDKKMRQAIWNLFGKYPTQPAGAAIVKQKITPFDTCVQVAA